MSAPIPFPSGISRDMARVRILAKDLQRLVNDLDHHVVITPTAYARIGNLADDAWHKAHDLQSALNQVSVTAADRMCAEQDRSYAVESGEELSSIVRRLAFDLTDGGAA
jgi:uncharacterized membrane protein